MRTKALILFSICALSIALSAEASAQTPAEQAITASLRAAADASIVPELRNMRSMGMGEAFVGAGSGTGAIYHNPATILSAAIYEGSMGYQHGFTGGTNAIGVSLADAKTNPSVAAGVAYSFGFGNDPQLRTALNAQSSVSNANVRVRDHDIRGAIAFPLVPGTLSVGAGLRYINHSRGSWTQGISVNVDTITDGDGDPLTTDDQIVTSTPGVPENREYKISRSGVTLDGGIMAQLGSNMALGFAVRNILEIKGLNEGRIIEGGIGGYFGGAHVEIAYIAEQLEDGFEHGVAVGLEYVAGTAPVRAGFRHEGAGRNYLAAGFGYRSESVGGDFAYEQNVNQSDDRTLGASLSLYF
ncbi:MAG: hypothetical protein ACJAYU_005339 [Bradymonadia bacterium]|jgi:hypothetical protein